MTFKISIPKDAFYLKCIYYFFKAFGLATMNLDTKHVAKTRMQYSLFTRSKVGVLYNALLICALVMMYAFIMYLGFVDNYMSEMLQQFDGLIDLTHTTLAGVTAAFVLIVFCFQQKQTLLIANRLQSLSDLSTNLYEDATSKETQKLSRDVRNIGLTIGVTWLSIFVTTEVSSWECLIYYFYIYLCNMIITWTLIQYSLILRAVHQILRVIDANFRHVFSEFSHYRMIGRFSHMREQYLSLCELAEDICEFYSQPMLLCIAYIFLTLIFFAHHIAKPMMIDNNKLPNSQLIHCSFRILHYIVSLIILTNSVNIVVSESKRIRKIVNKCIGNLNAQQIDLKFHNFANYLLHYNLNFSVLGLFSLDGSLLISITAMITTYLVIFLQFQNNHSNK